MEEPLLLFAELEVYSPPQAGEPWTDHHGDSYQPVGEEQVGSVGEENWAQYRATKAPGGRREFLELSQKAAPAEIGLPSPEEATAFC